MPRLALILMLGVALQAAADDKPKYDLRGHNASVTQVAFSPDGKRLASVALDDEKISIWDLSTGRRLKRIGPPGRLVGLGAGPASLSNETRRYEAIAFHPDSGRLAEAADERGAGSFLRIWDIEKPATPRILTSGQRNIRALAFSPDGKLIANTEGVKNSGAQMIVLRDVESGDVVGELRSEKLSATNLVFSPDGNWIATAGGRSLHIWDVANRKLKHTINAHTKAIQALAFSPDSESVATGGADDLIRIWKVEDGSRLLEITAGQEGVLGLAFSTSGRSVISAGANNQGRVFSTGSGRRRDTLWGHVDRVTTVDVSRDGTLIATGSRDRNILVWNFKEPEGEPKEEKPQPKQKKRIDP